MGLLNDEVKARPSQPPYSENYFVGVFNRIHKESYYMDGVNDVLEQFSCHWPECWFLESIPRREFLLVHLQEYHDEDVGLTSEEELAGRRILPESWRCSLCLINNNVREDGWVCRFCQVFCEESRVSARIQIVEKFASQEPGINTLYHGSTNTPASTKLSSQSGQPSASTPSFGGASQLFQQQPSIPQSHTSADNILTAALEVAATENSLGPARTGYGDELVGRIQPSVSRDLYGAPFTHGALSSAQIQYIG